MRINLVTWATLIKFRVFFLTSGCFFFSFRGNTISGGDNGGSFLNSSIIFSAAFFFDVCKSIFFCYNLSVNAFSSNYLLTVSLSLGHYIPNFAAGEESPHVRRTSLFDYFKSHSQISFQSHLVHLRNRGLQVALIIVTVASLKSIKHSLKNEGEDWDNFLAL
jgi:hypothetical protein